MRISSSDVTISPEGKVTLVYYLTDNKFLLCACIRIARNDIVQALQDPACLNSIDQSSQRE